MSDNLPIYHNPDHEIADLMVFSVWKLRRLLNDALAPLGLGTFHYSALMNIALGNITSLSELGERLGIVREAASALVSELESKELLISTPEGLSNPLALTDKGEAARQEANKRWRALTQERYKNLDEATKDALLNTLRSLHSDG